MQLTRTLSIWTLLFCSAAAALFLAWEVTASAEAEARTLAFGSPTEHEFYHTIPVIFHNDETPLNAVRMEILYDPTALFVFDIAIHAICEDRFLITKDIDQTNGTIIYECGTISPLLGTTTHMATIFSIPLVHGTSTLTFGTTTSIHAHDGFGTQVLEAATSRAFRF